ncbi:DedA family protein [Altererythrobacter xixiisoli]|uniref:DedA family protein n=1 Tax=Croceibacterium xixiisoli TaxID=1476466 RepID=A0A6I4TPM8_9SPHN|nr:DedA family protein [Croceibacterium xixiisoli]MXO98085.1 DedA family protein [Croceibacterium xixiisoli]
MTVEALLAQFGLPAIFLGAAAEGETAVILGGVIVHRGLAGFIPAVAMAALGSFLADQLFFFLGRRFRDHPRIQALRRRPAFDRAARLFARYPTGFVFLFRFLYGLRTVSPLAIGTLDFPPARFLLLNALAALLWASVFITLGYVFGQSVEALFGRIRPFEHVLLAVVALSVVGALLFHLIRRRRHRAG